MHPLFLWVAIMLGFCIAVKHNDFKTCNQSGFCQRNRAFADKVVKQGPSYQPEYKIDKNDNIEDSSYLTTLIKVISGNNATVRLPLILSVSDSGGARLQVDEERRLNENIELRHGSKTRKRRYHEAGEWALFQDLVLSSNLRVNRAKDFVTLRYGQKFEFSCEVYFDPFRIVFKRNGTPEIVLNARNFLNYEHWRSEPLSDEKGEDQATWWDESFGGATDSKPRGPESVAMDIEFPGYSHVYGIPEHASPLSLKETRGGEGSYTDPYRLYNTDVFEYQTDSPMSLYGSIPFMQAQRKGSSAGVFWLNGAETWVDIRKTTQGTYTHWMSESGIMDIFIFLGDSPSSITKQYASLTGFTKLPPLFSLAYHQCRWNYVSDEDVKAVDRKFDRSQIPYDVIWLDIEYTDDKKYFTWNRDIFKDPVSMQKQLERHGRKLVVIIDPHIKAIEDGSYHIVEGLKTKSLAVLNSRGDIYQGHCWPGASHWVDCFNPMAMQWWKTLFATFPEITSITHIWNDMNEPSVFSGPELTMPRDNLHYGGWENRDLHNIFGLTFHNATYHALLARNNGTLRPFTLTRAFFAGSQRLGALWTGDNEANWEHLAQSFPMLLSSGVAGLPFAGADVPGYFGNPEPELIARWYQAGAFYPFFRGHAHIDTHRREPYLLPQPCRDIVMSAMWLRYSLLPTWYSFFHEASVNGTPVLRPMFYGFPSDEKGFEVGDQFLLGSSGLLVKPVVEKGKAVVDIYLPEGSGIWYDYFDYTVYQGQGQRQDVPAPLEKLPILINGGQIISRRDRPRRSSTSMQLDPFTLLVTLDESERAKGCLYLDDGESFRYKEGAYLHRSFLFEDGKLVSEEVIHNLGEQAEEYLKSLVNVIVERIIVVGAPKQWRKNAKVAIKSTKGSFTAELEFHGAMESRAAWAVIHNANLPIAEDWHVDFCGVVGRAKEEL